MQILSDPHVSIWNRAWYAVHALPNHERRVADGLRARSVEFFYPTFSSKRRWRNGTEPVLQRPLLPGYLFVNIAKSERTHVLGVPSVLGIAGNGREMLPIPGEEVERLRSGCQLGRLSPHPLLSVGQRARLKSGPLAGFTGVVTRQRGGLRIVVQVEFAARAIAVEVDLCDLDPVPVAIA